MVLDRDVSGGLLMVKLGFVALTSISLVPSCVPPIPTAALDNLRSLGGQGVSGGIVCYIFHRVSCLSWVLA